MLELHSPAVNSRFGHSSGPESSSACRVYTYITAVFIVLPRLLTTTFEALMPVTEKGKQPASFFPTTALVRNRVLHETFISDARGMGVLLGSCSGWPGCRSCDRPLHEPS